VGVLAASAWADSRGRDSKGSAVSFRMASTTAVKGYDKMTVETDGSTVYVSPRPIWSGGEVVSAQTRDSALELTLSSDTARRLESAREGGDRVAVFVDGQLNSVGTLSTNGGRATIKGLNSPSTERVMRLLNRVRPAPAPTPISAMVTLVPSGAEGDLHFVDVFVQGVTGLRTYQVSLVVDGGTQGELVRDEVSVEEQRPDFVFKDLDVITAADQIGGRAMSTLRDGIVDRPEASYLGTYAFRATPDAAGTFEVTVDMSEKSFLADSQNEMIEFQPGPAAVITVGGNTRRTGEK
jgi:hypothetical protein